MKAKLFFATAAAVAFAATSATAGGFSYGSLGGNFGNWSYGDAAAGGSAYVSGKFGGQTTSESYATVVQNSGTKKKWGNTTNYSFSSSQAGNQSSFSSKWGGGYAHSGSSAVAGGGTGFGIGGKIGFVK
jgi:hypothetical protein